MKRFLLIDWFRLLFPLLAANNCFSLSATDIALFFMFIFAISLAFFIIELSGAWLPIIIGWLLVGLALGHADKDDCWLPAEEDADDDGVAGRLTADEAMLKFNDCGRGAMLPLLFDVSNPPIDFDFVRSSLLLPLP